MKITIVSVGKQHSILYRDAIAEFERRLARHCTLSWKFISPGGIQQESEAIGRILSGHIVLLDETGVSITTSLLAERLETFQNQAVKEVMFIIGGAYGVTDELKAQADEVISLSGLVFPHQLVRLIVVEQLYRAYDILAGGKYHHE